jgi:hypothetical protein
MRALRLALLPLPGLLACASEDVAAPYAVLTEQGIDRYLGAYEPDSEDVDAEGIINHAFTDPAGPACMDGAPFHTAFRDQGSSDLVVFLQGGGLCYSELCLAVSSAGPGIPPIDVLRPDLETNPVRGWNMAYVPYCDGSLFSGDAEIDDDGDGAVDRIHHGLMNLSAALDVAASHHAAPERIFLAGSSGGGYGTIAAAVLARLTWPDAELMVFNDAGVGLGRDGDLDFLWTIIDEFNASALVPADEVQLLDGGHLTPLIGWQLEQDPNLRVAAYSSYGDYVISQMYLQASPEDFEDWLTVQLGAVHAAHPERFQSFLIEGVGHTTLLGDPSGFLSGDSPLMSVVSAMLGGIDTTEADGVTIAQWVASMIDDDGWISIED